MKINIVPIRIRNPIREFPAIELNAKVDSGATLLVLPEPVAREFEFSFIRKQTVKYANEDTTVRDIVGMVEVEIVGRKGWFEAIVEPKKNYALIGAVVMESLDLIIEPRSLGLYPNPRSDLPMAEVE